MDFLNVQPTVSSGGGKGTNPSHPSPLQQSVKKEPSTSTTKSGIENEAKDTDAVEVNAWRQTSRKQQQTEAIEALRQMNLLPMVFQILDRVADGKLAPKDVHNEVSLS